MKKLSLLFFCALILSACGAPATQPPPADVSAVQTNAVQTAWADATLKAPTATPEPTEIQPTSTLSLSLDEVRKQNLANVVAAISKFDDVESVTVARFNAGALEVELKTKWASQDRQPDVSWTVIQMLANSFAKVKDSKANLDTIAGGPFSITVTTYSTDGKYPYHSSTNWDTILKLAEKTMSYEEWIAAAGAGFKE